MPFIPELARFIPDLTIQVRFPGSSRKQRGKGAAVPILAPGRAGHHSTGTNHSQQKAFDATRWCPALAYGCCLTAWTRMQSGLGMELAGHHIGSAWGCKPVSPSPACGETPKPHLSFARQRHTPSLSSLDHHRDPSDLGGDLPWQFQGQATQPGLSAALWPLSL